MNSVIDNLKSFNRKERFYLVGAALGNPEFKLDPHFQDNLSSQLGITIPPGTFVAMDYHIDWIYASIFLSVHGEAGQPFPGVSPLIAASQEDVDLLIAFEEASITHLIFLEAKGVMYFSNQQLSSKAARLKRIFEDAVVARAEVKPYFAIVSPAEPKRVDTSSWSIWMNPRGKPIWLELSHLNTKIASRELRRIVRCDKNGLDNSQGDHWKLVSE